MNAIRIVGRLGLGALVAAFFVAAWAIEFWPTGETARVLGLLVCAPLALIVAFALLARWLY